MTARNDPASDAVAAASTTPGLPVRFAGMESEWSAVRRRCGLLDGRIRGLLRLNGSDRITFLQGMLSNDVAKIGDGEGTYAAHLTQQAKLVSDMRVYVLAEEVWLDAPASRLAAVRAALEHFLVADDVEFVDDGAVGPLFAVEGPEAALVAAKLGGSPVDALPRYGHRAVRVDGTDLRVACVTHTGEPGYLFFGPPSEGARLFERARAAGAEPVGTEALDVLRLEAGIPWFGRDMDESTLIGEAGLEEAVSYTKGCYLGQEVVERVASRGQVQRKLVGLRCDGAAVPRAGDELQRDGREVGRVTSAAWSPAANAVIALAYVRREAWEPGTELSVVGDGASLSARVAALPFCSQESSGK